MAKQKILNKITEYETIIIHRHVRPDADALGSQCGLKEMIRLSFPEKEVYAVGEEDPALHFFARMDVIDDAKYENALVIVCDTANTGRISDQRYTLGKEVIKIDHHPNNDPYGDTMWVDTSASSTSEMIFDFYKFDEHGVLRLNSQIARLIYGGIVGDTGRFLFPSTSNKTFKYAAELIEYPFDRSALYNGLYDIQEDIARLRGYVLQNFTLSPAGMSSIKLTKDILNKFKVEPIDTGKLVGVLGDVQGIKAWVFFIEEDDVIRVRVRSKGPVINELAAKYNGGGHPLAAGASIQSWEEANKFVNDLEELCAKYT
ncbi:bifunctional oligoribonuclease/PAP phosphatase NrnA [Pseudogracilibacillus sp. SE30717A]|uniref:DHH family phosphoesterase n=1 Tax=Pseudogracilibacillus sp. SE30717A TaxID=3098293 RepID=UPI00300DF2A9